MINMINLISWRVEGRFLMFEPMMKSDLKDVKPIVVS